MPPLLCTRACHAGVWPSELWPAMKMWKSAWGAWRPSFYHEIVLVHPLCNFRHPLLLEAWGPGGLPFTTRGGPGSSSVQLSSPSSWRLGGRTMDMIAMDSRMEGVCTQQWATHQPALDSRTMENIAMDNKMEMFCTHDWATHKLALKTDGTSSHTITNL